MKCDQLNQTLHTYQGARSEFETLCKAVDQALVSVDRHHLMLPGDIIVGEWGMIFHFDPDLKRRWMDRFSDNAGCRLDHVGLLAWKESFTPHALLSVYIELDCDETSWALIKAVAEQVDGDIHLHSDTWHYTQIKCRGFDLTEPLDPQAIAREIVDTVALLCPDDGHL